MISVLVMAGVVAAGALAASRVHARRRRLGALASAGRIARSRAGVVWVRPSIGLGRAWLIAAVVAGTAIAVAVLVAGGRPGDQTGRSYGPVAAVELGLCGGALAGGAVRLVVDAVMRRRRDRLAARYLAAVGIICSELEAGGSLDSALDGLVEVVPHCSPFLADPAGQLPSDPMLASLGRAVRLSMRTGAPTAEVLRAVRADLADRADARRDLDGELAGARASGVALAVLPGLGALLGGGIGADPFGWLTGTPAGRAVLCVGVLLELGGVAATRWIARGE